MKNETMNIFFSFDDNYAPCFAVAIKSLEDNANKNYDYKIRILHTGNISLKNREQIYKEFNKGNFHIEFIDITERIKNIFDKLHTRDYYSKSTYYRLFIPELFPELDKALYLDSDIVVNEDIVKLYSVELGDNLVAAIPDEVIASAKVFQEYVENRIGVESYKKYFNAGIILMNLKKMREISFTDKFIKVLSVVTFNLVQDEDYLNVLCKGNIVFMPSIWNKMPFESDIKENEVCIFHYTLDNKPWLNDGILYGDIFWKYAKKTSYFEILKNILATRTEEERNKGKEETKNLCTIARAQADDYIENKKIAEDIKDVLSEYSSDINTIFEKIQDENYCDKSNAN